MEFQIRRTSLWSEDTPPCDEAFRKSYIRIDERTVNDPSKLNFKEDRESWLKEGTNHRVENGHIKRDFKDEDWFIKVNSLKEMFSLYQKYGDIIISSCWNNSNIPSLEIYDDYRE